MTTRTKSRIYVSIAAVVLMTALRVPAAAQGSCAAFGPGCFTGTFEGQDAHDVLPPEATSTVISTTATGVATKLGRFSLNREVTASFLDYSAAGSAEWVAANDESIYTTVDGQAGPSDVPGFLKVTETHTITGGTGRFTEAQGIFIVELLHRLEPSSVVGGVQTHDISGFFHGTITFPAAGR